MKIYINIYTEILYLLSFQSPKSTIKAKLINANKDIQHLIDKTNNENSFDDFKRFYQRAMVYGSFINEYFN